MLDGIEHRLAPGESRVFRGRAKATVHDPAWPSKNGFDDSPRLVQDPRQVTLNPRKLLHVVFRTCLSLSSNHPENADSRVRMIRSQVRKEQFRSPPEHDSLSPAVCQLALEEILLVCPVRQPRTGTSPRQKLPVQILQAELGRPALPALVHVLTLQGTDLGLSDADCLVAYAQRESVADHHHRRIRDSCVKDDQLFATAWNQEAIGLRRIEPRTRCLQNGPQGRLRQAVAGNGSVVLDAQNQHAAFGICERRHALGDLVAHLAAVSGALPAGRPLEHGLALEVLAFILCQKHRGIESRAFHAVRDPSHPPGPGVLWKRSIASEQAEVPAGLGLKIADEVDAVSDLASDEQVVVARCGSAGTVDPGSNGSYSPQGGQGPTATKRRCFADHGRWRGPRPPGAPGSAALSSGLTPLRSSRPLGDSRACRRPRGAWLRCDTGDLARLAPDRQRPERSVAASRQPPTDAPAQSRPGARRPCGQT